MLGFILRGGIRENTHGVYTEHLYFNKKELANASSMITPADFQTFEAEWQFGVGGKNNYMQMIAIRPPSLAYSTDELTLLNLVSDLEAKFLDRIFQ